MPSLFVGLIDTGLCQCVIEQMLIDTDHPYLVYVAVTFFALLCRENCPITGAGLGKNFLFLVNVKGTSDNFSIEMIRNRHVLHRNQN